MLASLEMSSIDELFADIPDGIRLKRPLDLPDGLSEFEVTARIESLAAANRVDRVSFLGCGSYDHIVPATVPYVMGRSEFATSYTPYQAEISQGLLQAIFEFQSLMCELTGLDVSNASLYDGASAAAEACTMAIEARPGSDAILVSETLHPGVRRVLATYFSHRGVRLLAVREREGAVCLDDLDDLLGESVAALIVQSPNIYGYLEDYEGVAERVHAAGALFIVTANPMSLPLLRTPREWGADIAAGDTQPFGIPPYFGGPTAGYLTAVSGLLRKMPGRIVGETLDAAGDRAFVLTLQTREQHIKRERATSNICTNQALVALGNAAYLATVGEKGLREVCALNVEKARYLHARLVEDLGLRPLADRPFFNEFTIRLPRRAEEVLRAMEGEGYHAGVALGGLKGGPDDLVAVAVTEKRTRAELDGYVEALRRVLR